MKLIVRLAALGTAALLATSAGPATAPSRSNNAPFWSATASPAEFVKAQDARLDRARAAITRMTGVTKARTIANTLRPYDDAVIELQMAGSQAGLIEEVHPDSAMRATAEAVSRKVSALQTELSLNRAIYDALSALDVSKTDPTTQHYVQRLLRDFRLAGVDRDEATRAKITELRKQIVETGQDFGRNIRTDVRKVTVASAAELEGLPADYIARHKPAADGTITITTDNPDARPVFDYANNPDLRRRLYLEYQNRAYPQNMAVLDSLIARRHRLANLLGFPSYAEYITADKMVGSARNASEFIDKIVEVSRPIGVRDYQTLLAAKQKQDPNAAGVEQWESAYWSERVRKADYDFDGQKVRPYFAYPKVKQGILDLTSTLFGVTFKPAKDVPVWDPSVECYELWDQGKLAGRFYLDMHPRANKYKHAAHFGIRVGVAGRQIPEAALVCNFPGGEAGDPGLMEHGDVETFLHEFGHLLHNLFAGRGEWAGVGGIRTERDFAEAPSQMLEEWAWDPTVLARFAHHHETGAPIPADLVKQMKRAAEFGRGLGNLRQMVYARTSLSFYDRDPAQVDTDRITRELVKSYQPFAPMEGTHFQTAFGHLDGYSAVYYTYMWSLVIAKDMYSQFDRSNLLDPTVAGRYRKTVLAPGGSKPAAKLVEEFLGRPFSFEAYRAWLNEAS